VVVLVLVPSLQLAVEVDLVALQALVVVLVLVPSLQLAVEVDLVALQALVVVLVLVPSLQLAAKVDLQVQVPNNRPVDLVLAVVVLSIKQVQMIKQASHHLKVDQVLIKND